MRVRSIECAGSAGAMTRFAASEKLLTSGPLMRPALEVDVEKRASQRP
jgi:hypothetical protein